MSKKKRILRIFTLISAIAFLGSTGFNLIRMLTNPARSTQVSTQAEDLTQQLQAQARGYEMVLQRDSKSTLSQILIKLMFFQFVCQP